MIDILKDCEDKPKEDEHIKSEDEGEDTEDARQELIEQLEGLQFERVGVLHVEEAVEPIQAVEVQQVQAVDEEDEDVTVADMEAVIYLDGAREVEEGAVYQDVEEVVIELTAARIYRNESGLLYVVDAGIVYRECDAEAEEAVAEEPIQIENEGVEDIPDIVIELIDEIIESVMEQINQ